MLKAPDTHAPIGAGLVAMNLQPIEAGRHLGDPADRQAGARESLGARPPQLNLAGPAARERELPQVKSRTSRKR